MAHVPAERCLGIIELLADGAREMPLGEIADRLVLPKSGAHRRLATLVDLGWAEQDSGNGGFNHADRYGPNVIRSIEALLRDLRTTARRGYGLALNEAEPGVTAIAAAVRSGRDGAAVGTVSIAGPTARVPERRIRELAPLVRQCA